MRRTLALAAAALAAVAGLAVGPPTTAGHPAPAYAVCAEEDGSTPGQPLPCYWDAAHRGNGQGDSYVLTAPVCSPAEVARSDAAHRAGHPITMPCDDLESLTGSDS